MTKKIFWKDPYQTNLETHVTSIKDCHHVEGNNPMEKLPERERLAYLHGKK